MEIKCPMYMWDGFSGHRKACRNVIYTVHVQYIHKNSSPFIVGNNFFFVFVTHTLIAVFFHQLLKCY